MADVWYGRAMKVHRRLVAGLLRTNHVEAERHAFWSEVERRLGTPVLGHGLGRYLSGEVDPGPLYGLLYCTADALYFHHFAQVGWFSAFTAGVGATSACRRLLEPRQPTPLQRWLGREEVIYRLPRTDADTFAFSIDHRREPFANVLVTAFNHAHTR